MLFEFIVNNRQDIIALTRAKVATHRVSPPIEKEIPRAVCR